MAFVGYARSVDLFRSIFQELDKAYGPNGQCDPTTCGRNTDEVEAYLYGAGLPIRVKSCDMHEAGCLLFVQYSLHSKQ